MTPREAYAVYNQAVETAAAPYEQYWLAKFLAAGIQFHSCKWPGTYQTTHAQYSLELQVYPRYREGIILRVTLPPAGPHRVVTWREVKVLSDSGFNKFMCRLTRGEF